MPPSEEEVTRFLADNSKRSDALESVLAVDKRNETWGFQNVPVSSGVFGELVDRNIVERVDSGYRLADPDVVRKALGTSSESSATDSEGGWDRLDLPLLTPRFDDWENVKAAISTTMTAWEAAVFASAIAVVVAVRSFNTDRVFRRGDVVLGGNDPYFYLHFLERLVSTGPFDPSALMEVSAHVGEPLYLTTGWLLATVLGEGSGAAVLAWHPVVSGIVTALLSYLIAVRLTDDRRVGLAAVLLIAVTPAHAFRTALGFSDHHAFDLVWLALSVYGLVLVINARTKAPFTTTRLAGGVCLAVGSGAQVLAWNAGPLLLLPIGAFVFTDALVAIRVEESPIPVGKPVATALFGGGVLSLSAHALFGWQRLAVALSPLLLAVGVGVVTAIAATAHRRDAGVTLTAGANVALGVFGVVLVTVAVPGFLSTFTEGIHMILFTSGIAETRSIFHPDTGSIFAPVLLFGGTIVLALPYMGVETARSFRNRTPRWQAMAIYAWMFLILSVVQRRFTGELTVVLVLFAALGFVKLGAKLDVLEAARLGISGTDPDTVATSPRSLSVPAPRTAAVLVVFFLLVAGFGIIQSPIRVNQVTTEPAKHDAALSMAAYAEETAIAGGGKRVLSRWGDARMYNQFVTGSSKSYQYSYTNYASFVSGADGSAWFRRLHGRVGFVVTTDTETSFGPNTLQSKLHRGYGRDTGHFRTVYVSEDGGVKAFALVSGSVLTGKTTPNTTVTVRTSVPAASSDAVYRRTVQATESGWFATRVPYPGVYTLESGDGTVDGPVSEAAVVNGQFATDRQPRANWQFDAGQGRYVFDDIGGNHGIVVGANWTNTGSSAALRLDGNDLVGVQSDALNGSNGFSTGVCFRTGQDETTDGVHNQRLLAKAPSSSFRNTTGYQIGVSGGTLLGALGNGSEAPRLNGPAVDDGQWHAAALTWDGETARLYLDGERVAETRYTGSISNDARFTFGATSNNRYHFVGMIDEGRYEDRTVGVEGVRDWAASCPGA